jgi:hypothetical protein
VGCVAQGQLEDFKAPTGTPHLAAIRAENAQKLAYYRAAIDLGVLSPRGWYLRRFLRLKWRRPLAEPGIDQPSRAGMEGVFRTGHRDYHISSGASGMYDVAELLARVFRGYKDQAARIGID